MSSSKPPKSLDFWGYIAVAYPLGLSPKAPGTVGSIPGLAVGAFIHHLSFENGEGPRIFASGICIFLLAICTIIALVSIARTEAKWGTHDDGSIVIDEVVGQAIPVAFLGYSLTQMILAFVLFRFFDIIKPGPIGWADRSLPGAYGTLFDDIIAGFFALTVVWLIQSQIMA